VSDVRILVDMVDTVGIEQRRTAFDAMDLVTFGKEKFGKVRSVLAGDSCDEGFFQRDSPLLACVFGEGYRWTRKGSAAKETRPRFLS